MCVVLKCVCLPRQDGEVCAVWDQRAVVWYSGGGGGVEVEVEVFGATQVHALFGVAKVAFTLELWCRHAARDSTPSPSPSPTPGPATHATRGNAAALCEELDTAAACFRLRGGRLMLHSGDGGGGVLCGGEAGVGAGDTAGGVFFKAAGGKKKGGGGGGGGGGGVQQEVAFQLVYNRSAVVGEGGVAAPVVRVDNCESSVVCAAVSGEAVAYLDKSGGVGQLGGLLAEAVAGQVRLAEHWLALQRGRPELRGPLTALATLPQAAGHLLALVYPAGVEEEALRGYRAAVHRALVFPRDRPMVRRANALTPAPGTRPSALVCPHAALAPPGVGGRVSVVQGGYAYYHYQQGKMDDKGWGCAYRSLQTIVSWYQLQGYTARPVPSHRAIQQCLVDIGDKPVDMVGSRRWIGSTEVGFVLETLFGVHSRFLCVSSGAELAGRAADLAHHFDTQGTPIMVGGGVLAHTLLGVAWDEATQHATAFLVLDPHYTGPDDTQTVTAKGGVAWKQPDFWKTDAFYNLCMPQTQPCI
ncbi:Ufm1-specific protease 2 [Portunus trituberculatus]|uniref:Probable Ufm1-specific protease 2 n=1 Tax=Portunus trituberculatus TaxID=210409 RepID=A0A5B7HIR0_PORTR|nr:Ufm1-specific protease 2 [Portunus trituberculatus]